ncbi:Predicted thioesterase [Peptoclostridium litorale DSM 5388]|uniref:Fluoroacetyl-CoA-specific thioesterase-like domain-containing protein n=1 Tax=Peptoclostridium litorale DSM 5388 TaxID=1121324 RepID=A0A069RCX5_PEPLI|nr:thioesterase family protein [Peptoclostridium litorale]KDR94919.1 hypothetical protein CLIT_13c02410 [Peptoclostridium litorale DSM 5388]SIN95673.1 Predicted thioesterase [Peptoclostridium litorale DSM 5388]
MKEIKPGVKASLEKLVKYEDTAAALGNKDVEVFATPVMVSLMEITCAQALEPYLEEGEGSVGVSLEIRHIAPTPVGMKVTSNAELTKVDGVKMEFKVEVFDENEKVGEGIHKRAVIDMDKFFKMVEKKKK